MPKLLDDRLDMLAEVVAHPGWQVVRLEARNYIETLVTQITTPAVDDFDLVRKEAKTQSVATLKQFIAMVEQRAEKYMKSVKREGG